MVVSAACGASLLNYIIMGSVQQLWGLIRGIQFTAFLALIDLKLPANAQSFLTKMMGIA
jgi:hypothetical protein